VETREIAPGLWRWTAPHPSWRRGADWPEEVGCVYYEAPDTAVLIDPLIPTGEEDAFLAHLDRDVGRLRRPVVILLTCDWHRRSTDELAERYGARIGGEVPNGLEEIPIRGAGERQVAYFIRPHRALVVAEIFAGHGNGGLKLCPSPALTSREELDASIEKLLELPVERVLVAHGEPVLSDGHRRMEEALALS
jgi:glyoxylase-like metal-dependent hydrolase (beta-lactamase superfamily II)